MEKKHWEYQHRKSDEPWALCVVETYPRGNRRAKKLGFDVYSELIPNKARCLRVAPKRYDSAVEAADYLTDMLAAFDFSIIEHKPQDHDQILRFISSILSKE